MSRFLSPTELRELTGFAMKGKQVEQLRKMAVPFFINGGGRPVVTTVAIEGRQPEPVKKQVWTPAVIKA